MDDSQRRTELKQFLRAHRERIMPEHVGLTPGKRRRTPGLRREEVAELAGVGVAWYSWFEMGRPIRVSRNMVESVARALRLNTEETTYFHKLALSASPQPPAARAPETVPAPLQAILDGFDGPAFFVNARLDVLAWNARAKRIFDYSDDMPPAKRNLLWRMLIDDDRRGMHVDWLDDIQHTIATFRRHYGEYLGDPQFEALIAELERVSPEFRGIWCKQLVERRASRLVRLHHPQVGTFRIEIVSLASPWNPLEHLVFFCRPDAEPEVLERLGTFLAQPMSIY